MSSSTYVYVPPPDIYHRLGLTGLALSQSAMSIRAELAQRGQWDEIGENEKAYLQALQEGFNEIQGLKAAILNEMASTNAVSAGPKASVSDHGMGNVGLGGTTGNASSDIEAAMRTNAASSRPAVGAIDLSSAFVSPRASGNSKDGYLDNARSRLSKLLAINDGERARLQEMSARIDAIARSGLGQGEQRRMIEGDLETLEKDLSEGGKDRSNVLATYVALCRSAHEPPKELDYHEMRSEIERIEGKIVSRRLRDKVSHMVSDALAEAGLADAGVMVLDGREQRLLVDDGETECGLALSEDDDGSFVFTTVAEADPAIVDQERRARIAASAKRLCSKKEEALMAALLRRGIVANIRFDSGVDLSLIRKSDKLAELAEAKKRPAEIERRRREVTRGRARAREA